MQRELLKKLALKPRLDMINLIFLLAVQICWVKQCESTLDAQVSTSLANEFSEAGNHVKDNVQSNDEESDEPINPGDIELIDERV